MIIFIPQKRFHLCVYINNSNTIINNTEKWSGFPNHVFFASRSDVGYVRTAEKTVINALTLMSPIQNCNKCTHINESNTKQKSERSLNINTLIINLMTIILFR